MSDRYAIAQIEDGNSSYARFERGLGVECKAEAKRLRDELALHGHDLRRPTADAIGGVRELRGKCEDKQLRIYYFWCAPLQSFILATAELKKGAPNRTLLQYAERAKSSHCSG